MTCAGNTKKNVCCCEAPVVSVFYCFVCFFATTMVKAVILIGGPNKGTRFRPLSLDVPKPLFPIAGKPMIYHHIEALAQVQGFTEVILLGYYKESQFTQFAEETSKELKVKIRYAVAPHTISFLLYHSGISMKSMFWVLLVDCTISVVKFLRAIPATYLCCMQTFVVLSHSKSCLTSTRGTERIVQ